MSHRSLLIVVGLLALPSLAPGAEVLVGVGHEPTVAANRKNDDDSRVCVAYIQADGHGIDTEYSDDDGASWAAMNPFTIDDTSSVDPTLCSNPSLGDIFAAYITTSTGAGSFAFRRSTDGENWGSIQALQTYVAGMDRPWIAAGSTRAYCSYFQGTLGVGSYSSIRCRYGDLSGGAVDWAGGSSVEVAYLSGAEPAYSLHAPIAVGSHDGSTKRGYILGMKYYQSNNPRGDNKLTCFRTSNGGVDWTATDVVNLDGANRAGFYVARDHRLFGWHISCNVATGYVYAFYVKTFDLGESDGPMMTTYQALYCKRSTDHGATWGSEVLIAKHNEAQSYGDVATPSGESAEGFYRIGKVWSCIDGNGDLHVVWFDNREGLYNDNRDKWNVYRASSTNDGVSFSEDEDPVSTDWSVGGYAAAGDDPSTYRAFPPGHFISCDADDSFLYVAWPDSRTWHTGATDEPLIFVNALGL